MLFCVLCLYPEKEVFVSRVRQIFLSGERFGFVGGSLYRIFLKENTLIRNADLCEGLCVSTATANRILRELCAENTLKRVRDGKFWAYRSAGAE